MEKQQRLIDVGRFCADNQNFNSEVYVALSKAPTIDAEPVRHGHWVKCQGKSNIWYCSECGEKINYKQNRRTYNIPKVPVWQKNKRCRCCGAKMDFGGMDNPEKLLY